MFSTTSLVIFGIVAIVVVAVVWKFWKKKPDDSKKNEEIQDTKLEVVIPGKDDIPKDPPPMVFAVNDGGFLDLTDINGKMLDSKWGPNPKVYINLLDLAEKDTEKIEKEGQVIYVPKEGPTKSYIVVGQSYIINYTRL
jgi:hypothetical protein